MHRVLTKRRLGRLAILLALPALLAFGPHAERPCAAGACDAAEVLGFEAPAPPVTIAFGR